jgi:hypothetical protein
MENGGDTFQEVLGRRSLEIMSIPAILNEVIRVESERHVFTAGSIGMSSLYSILWKGLMKEPFAGRMGSAGSDCVGIDDNSGTPERIPLIPGAEVHNVPCSVETIVAIPQEKRKTSQRGKRKLLPKSPAFEGKELILGARTRAQLRMASRTAARSKKRRFEVQITPRKKRCSKGNMKTDPPTSNNEKRNSESNVDIEMTDTAVHDFAEPDPVPLAQESENVEPRQEVMELEQTVMEPELRSVLQEQRAMQAKPEVMGPEQVALETGFLKDPPKGDNSQEPQIDPRYNKSYLILKDGVHYALKSCYRSPISNLTNSDVAVKESSVMVPIHVLYVAIRKSLVSDPTALKKL